MAPRGSGSEIALQAVRGAAAGVPRPALRLLGRENPSGLAPLFPGIRFVAGPNSGAARHWVGVTAPLSSTEAAGLFRRHGVPILRLRPGLLRTPPFRRGLPWLSGTVAGIVADGAAGPGAAQAAVAELAGVPPDPAVLRRAELAVAHIVSARLGGTAWADPPPDAALRGPGAGLALIVAPRDAALSGRIVRFVLGRCDAARTAILLPPGSSDGKAIPAWAAEARRQGCRVLPGPVDPWPLLDACAELHVGDDTALGFLGLLAGRDVHSHAPCWYSGWGLTRDEWDQASQAGRCSLATLAAAGLLVGTAYADPFTGRATSCEAALDLAAEWRRVGQANRAVAAVTGMQAWKRRRIGQFLHTGASPPPYRGSAAQAVAAARKAGGAVAFWSSRMPPELPRLAADAGVPVLRVEDGFVRSVGLGSDFLPPCSIILDRSGVYYDPRQPSDLERLLAETEFDPGLLHRARRLVDQLVRTGITKYNTGISRPVDLPPGRRCVLVPGQVTDDLSVRLGGAGILCNEALLRRVRASEPDAYILYKPHPDVDAGHRPGGLPDAAALRHADQIVRGVSMVALIDAVQEVHTLTSLAGFEALLRGRKVTAWGQPFYAGWGLTRDMAPLPRRQRCLTLDELAAGVLLLYPRYVDPVTGMPCPAEVLMERLADARLWRPTPLVRLRRIQGRLAKQLDRWGQALATAGRRQA